MTSDILCQTFKPGMFYALIYDPSVLQPVKVNCHDLLSRHKGPVYIYKNKLLKPATAKAKQQLM